MEIWELTNAKTFSFLLFAKAQKVSKNAFAQLQPSANLPIRTNPRKDGIRIPNGKPQQFSKRCGLLHFPGLVTVQTGCHFFRTSRRTGDNLKIL